ncbi:Protein-lysine N-methyltransferase Efm4 [Malassezia pachydermatis]
MTTPVESLPESKLGTKEHWDSVYAREVATYEEIGDEGEVWFGEDSVERMVQFLAEWMQDEHLQSSPYVLDLGTGNGHLLFALLEAQQEEDIEEGTLDATRMLGVDYSPASIQLAQAIGQKRGPEYESVRFEEADLRDDACVKRLREKANHKQGWDIVCDKGTIALSSQPIHDKLPVDLYVEAVQELTKSPTGDHRGGLFFITSCNFTEQELTAKFGPAGFEVEHVVPTPSFTFGGQKGAVVTTIAFRHVQ